jgi:hypothetical protein
MFGLNFIIAIVEENYQEMLPLRKQYIYRSKAELNHECYQMLKHVWPLESYRAIMFARRCIREGQLSNTDIDTKFYNLTDRQEI